MSAQGTVRVVSFSIQEPALAAPSISSVTISSAAIGIPVAATVAWTGYPRTGLTYQWTLDGVTIPGATGASYTPTASGELRCVASVNNGVGTDTLTSQPQTVAEAIIDMPAVTWGDNGTVDSETVPGTYAAGTQVLLWLSEGFNNTAVSFGGVAMTLVARSTAHSDSRSLALWRANLSSTLTNPTVTITKENNQFSFLVGIASAPQGAVTATAANATGGLVSANHAHTLSDLVYVGFQAHSGDRSTVTGFTATGPGNIAANDVFGTFGSSGVRGVSAAAPPGGGSNAYTATTSPATPLAYSAMVVATVAVDAASTVEVGEGVTATVVEDGAGGFDITVTSPAEQAGTYNVSAAQIAAAGGAPILVVGPVEAA